MDLRLSASGPSPLEKEAVDALLAGRGEGVPTPLRTLLLPSLLAVQARAGWVSEGALNYICSRLDVAPAEAFGVASFYRMISLTPRPASMAYVCEDLSCRLKGSENLCRELENRLGPPSRPGEETNSPWQRSACLGHCEAAPAALITRAGNPPETFELAEADPSILAASLAGRSVSPASSSPRKIPQFGQKGLRLLRRVGIVDPESLSAYRAQGGYRALSRALELGHEGIVQEVAASRLLGRGGAAFPVGRKWEAVARAKTQPRYLVCNADESEPGTFKDRLLMEEDPFTLIEAMTIAGFATGCEKGYVYIRGEYPLAARRIANAIRKARSAELLGTGILGGAVTFDLEVRRGAGAYICGEETSLFNSIEGYRGEPRSKPPFPVESGLFGKPTLINNVETFANVPDIVLEGSAAFASRGTKDSTGTRLFCLSGCVARPGVYEVEMGTPLRSLLEMAGSVPAGRALKAVLLGGAAGSFVGPEGLELPLSFEGTRAAGSTLGSGAVMVFDDSVDLNDVLMRIAAFFREESCGQCVPCRVGTVRQEEWMHRFVHARDAHSDAPDLSLLSEVAQAMRDASICGLGQTAGSAIQSALRGLPTSSGDGK
jgi:NADH-quinone oxidoreductase subunit F